MDPSFPLPSELNLVGLWQLKTAKEAEAMSLAAWGWRRGGA